MTSKLTRARLEEIRDYDTCVTPEESAELARMALAAMDSEPVYQVYGDVDDTWSDVDEEEMIRCRSIGEDTRTLYSAPPAPVMSSEPVAEVVSMFGDPEVFGERELKLLVGIQNMPYGTKFYRHAQQPVIENEPVAEVLSSRPGDDTSTIDRALPVGTKLYRHAQPAPVVPEKATVGEMPFLGTSEGAYVRGWNDCRAAMLQELQKSAGVSNNCRSSENVQVMQDNGHKWSPWLIHPENCQCIECRSARLNGGKS
ncbi:TPA: hypothetical protein QHD31_005773 [Raoultella ornithinolytica]|nr:hypothetical protein [Raoultella ornithinolytica]